MHAPRRLINPAVFKGEQPGPNLLVLGAVHGNEICGPDAINQVIDDLEAAKFIVESGSVTFVPVCNPDAYARDRRYVDHNLNRFLGHPEDPNDYEAKIGAELCPLLARCDVLLDLHSNKAGAPPYIFVGKPDGPEHRFANALGVETVVTGWQAAYAHSGRVSNPKPYEATGTTEYARESNPNVIAVTCECGEHKSAEATAFAEQAILNALRFLDIASFPRAKKPAPVKATPLVELYNVIWREEEGGDFARDWQHLDPVEKGDIIAWQESGKEVTAAHDGCIILPDRGARQDEEWIYLGTMGPCPK